jgi:hypothetical protein
MAKYNNAQQQTAETGTALVKRLETSLGLPDNIKSNLMAGGLSPNDIGVVAAACVSTGVDPRLLKYSNNIPPVIRMMDMMKNHGYIPGEDFYVSVFTANAKLPDESGAPTSQTAPVPTIVVMPSAARAIANMKEDGRLYGKDYHIATKEIVGKEAREIFERDMPSGNYVEGKSRVVRALLKTFVKGIGALDTPGDEPVFYGFYSPSKKNYNGNIEDDYLETKKVKDNYSPVDIATKRAMTKAARYVTRTNYSRDNRPVDVRMAALIDGAQNRLVALEQMGNLEDAFDDGMVDVDAEATFVNPEPPAQVKAISANAVHMDEEFVTSVVTQQPTKTIQVANRDELDDLWNTATEIDSDEGVHEDPFAVLFAELDSAMSESNVRLIHEIRTSTIKAGITPAGIAAVMERVREIGGWAVGESFCGVPIPEVIVRFILKVGMEDDLSLTSIRALSSLILKGITKADGSFVQNKGYSEEAASMVWSVGDIFDNTTTVEVPA